MKPGIWRFLKCVFLVLLVGAEFGSVAFAAPLKIMPLGDSITDGVGGSNAGYRGPLHTLLTNASFDFEFVGSATNNPGPLPATQQQHEGHSGYVITAGFGRQGLTDNIGTWLGPAGADPDIILLMIGTNDVALNYDLATAPARLDNLVTLISNQSTGLKPNAHLIVAQITPVISIDHLVVAYNTGVASVVANHQALGENVSLVDMHVLSTATDMADSLHPNNAGYDKMAQIWFDGIETALVPEPSSLVLAGLGLVGLVWFGVRRRTG